VALLAAACALAGCASLTVQRVRVEPPELPRAVTPPIHARVGVVFPDALRTASIETAYPVRNDRVAWRHDIGEAAVASVRRALDQGFTEVVELDRLPDERTPRPDLAAVIVPSIESMWMEMPANSVTAVFRQGLRLDLALHSSSGVFLATWRVEGGAALGAHGPLFMRQARWDQATLRSAMAALVASIHEAPALETIRTRTSAAVSASSTAAAARASAVVLRLDAGLARDDGIERRAADCLSSAMPAPPGEPDPQPAATLRDRLFPWFDPGTAPRDTAGIERVLARPEVQERLRALAVTHLVLIAARDIDRARTDQLFCAGGFNAGVCFGVFEQREGYVVDLAVWDVAARRALETTAADLTRTIGVLGVALPIPYTYTTYQDACEKMRETVRRILTPP